MGNSSSKPEEQVYAAVAKNDVSALNVRVARVVGQPRRKLRGTPAPRSREICGLLSAQRVQQLSDARAITLSPPGPQDGAQAGHVDRQMRRIISLPTCTHLLPSRRVRRIAQCHLLGLLTCPQRIIASVEARRTTPVRDILNFTDKEGRTPLLVAAAKNHHQVARKLLEAGADVGYINPTMESRGGTALHEATRHRHEVRRPCSHSLLCPTWP